jgi:hypothetical protein
VTDHVGSDADRKSISRLDDLPGRVQFLAVACFFSLWAVIAFAPRLWGVDVFYEHFYWVGGVLGLVWWPAVLHFGPRLATRPRSQRQAAAGLVLPNARVLGKVRRVARLYSAQRASAWLIAPTLVLVYLSGLDATSYDEELISSQPHRTATVVEVYRSPLAGRTEGPEVTVELGDRTAVLGLSFPGEQDVVPGDQLQVVIDPDDPEYVIAANSHDDWVYTWWGGLILTAGIGALAGGIWLAWAMSAPRRPALAAARHVREVENAELVDVDDRRLRLRTGTGALWVWTDDHRTWSGRRDDKVRLLGQLQEDAWPVIEARGRLHWPAEPVRTVTRQE